MRLLYLTISVFLAILDSSTSSTVLIQTTQPAYLYYEGVAVRPIEANTPYRLFFGHDGPQDGTLQVRVGARYCLRFPDQSFLCAPLRRPVYLPVVR